MCQPKEPHSLDFLSAAGRPKTRERSGGCGGYRQEVVLTAEGKAPHEEDGAASPQAVKPLAVLRAERLRASLSHKRTDTVGEVS